MLRTDSKIAQRRSVAGSRRVRQTFLHSDWKLVSPGWLEPPGKLGFSVLEALPARVPGHVHLDLVENGLIEHPFVKLAEVGCQWVDQEDWTYETRFEFRADPELPHRCLRFEGLDTVCRVFLNDRRLAEHDNMFVPLEIDVSDALQDGTNQLRVEFSAAVQVGNERRERYLAQEGLPPNVQRFDERAFVRKAQYMFGWDWGPRLVSAGIWRPVSLIEHHGRILDVHVTQVHHADGSVVLGFASEVASEAKGGTLLHFVDDDGGVAGPSSDRPVADGETLRLERPELWWPVGLGGQHLYCVTSYLVDAEQVQKLSTCADVERAARDRRVTRVGLRTLSLVREPDEIGESFRFEVNGRALWCVGANWIPDHSFPSAVTPERVREQLERARDMNMNMLRIWGGGLYESDEFYDACDELGLLVWQDFPFACNYAPDDEPAREAVRVEAESNIRRLRNHPSLAIWCGNNENLTMFDSKWGDAKLHPSRYYGERIYDGTLPQALSTLDPERPYVSSSPVGGERANDGDFGDQHYWDVWHGRGDWKHYADSTGRFASEFGFVGAPGRATWRRMVADREPILDFEIRHPVARWHDKTGKGYETYVGYVELHYPAARSIEEWLYTSQLNQRDALRFGIEHFRRSTFCQGALIWQLNDCWPVQSWAVLDSEGDYKAAAFELRRLFAPALVSVEALGSNLRIWAICDNTPGPLAGEVSVQLRRLKDGKLVSGMAEFVELSSGQRRMVLEVNTADYDARTNFLVASFGDAATHRLLCEPKHAAWPVPQLSAALSDTVLQLRSDAPLIDAFIWDETDQWVFDDNFVCLSEPGDVLLPVSRRSRSEAGAPRFRARTLAGAHAIDLRD